MRRKLTLISLLVLVYTGVSFWVPYSKLWFIQDCMETQARLFFANQSFRNVREYLIRKAELLDIPVEERNVLVQNVNSEIVYIEMKWDAPVDIFFYHVKLHFEPKIFGLIRPFELAGGNLPPSGLNYFDSMLTSLSDSTTRFLNGKTIPNRVRDFFAR